MHAKLDLVIITACLAVPVFLFFFIRRKCQIDAAKKQEIKRLLILASEENARAELEATAVIKNDAVSKTSNDHHHCVVCYSKTTRLCSRCKAARYCSGKCQIFHWRQGHKDECHPPSTSFRNDDVGSEQSQKLAKQQHKMLEIEDRPLPKPITIPTVEPALSDRSSLSVTSSTGINDFKAKMFTDEENELSTSEFSSSTFSEFVSSKTTNKSSEDVSGDAIISSVDIDMLDGPVSVKGSVDLLEATLCAGDNDQVKPPTPVSVNLVGSAHTLSKLSKSNSDGGENASVVSKSSGSSTADGYRYNRSVEIDSLDAPVSVKDPADMLEATPGTGDNDQMKSPSTKFVHLVSSTHTLSKLSNSPCGDGENGAASIGEGYRDVISVDIDVLSPPLSVKAPADLLEANPGTGNNDQIKPASPKFVNLVSSAHTLSKLSNSTCGDEENASAFSESSVLCITDGKGKVESSSLRDSSDIWRGSCDTVEIRDDAQFVSGIDKGSSDFFGYSFHLPENAATESISKDLKPENCISANDSLSTKDLSLSNSACLCAPAYIKDPSVDCDMSFCASNDTCRSSPVLYSMEKTFAVSDSFAVSPLIKDADNGIDSGVKNVSSSDSRNPDQLASDACSIPMNLPDSSRVDCRKSISNTFTTTNQKNKSKRIHDVHGSHAVSSGVISYSASSKDGLKLSAAKVANQIRESNMLKCDAVGPGNETRRFNDKGLFPFEMFVKLYTWNKAVLRPCGLINCGNSCYANAVLQCLAFTPPLTAYFLHGLHSKTCRKKDWCFSCEFERLIRNVKVGISPISPVRILSQLQNIWCHLESGKQEDAHEFLRYAIENMQSASLRNNGLSTSISEEEDTTLIGLTFGGYLLSKIKCTKCKGLSERQERMMDLTVEIDGDIETLEEALKNFTRIEILDGENKYHCSRCKTYEKAKKKLTVLEAPNILTIALKRFQAGIFGKLNKPIRYPERLDMAPYMSRKTDKLPIYKLYAVVVHLDSMNAAFSGHYVCYVKNNENKWFKANDSTVTAVELDEVLTNNAYILLYARRTPRVPRILKSPDQKTTTTPRRNSGTDMSLKSGPASLRERVLKIKTDSALLYHSRSFNLHSGQSQKMLGESASECSSLISGKSEEGSCGTDSTHDSLSTGNISVFGDSGRCRGRHWESYSDVGNSSYSYLSSQLYSKASSITDLDHYASRNPRRSGTLNDDSDSALGAKKWGMGNID